MDERSERIAKRLLDNEEPLPMPSPQVAVQINIHPELSEEKIEFTLRAIRRHFYQGKGEQE